MCFLLRSFFYFIQSVKNICSLYVQEVDAADTWTWVITHGQNQERRFYCNILCNIQTGCVGLQLVRVVFVQNKMFAEEKQNNRIYKKAHAYNLIQLIELNFDTLLRGFLYLELFFPPN